METAAFKGVSKIHGEQFQVDVELDTVGFSDVYKLPGGDAPCAVAVTPVTGGKGKVRVTLASDERIAAAETADDLEWQYMPNDDGDVEFSAPMTGIVIGANAIQFECSDDTDVVRFQATKNT